MRLLSLGGGNGAGCVLKMRTSTDLPHTHPSSSQHPNLPSLLPPSPLPPSLPHLPPPRSQLFTEVYKAVDSKQLKPLVRTQYMRTAFQVRGWGGGGGAVWGGVGRGRHTGVAADQEEGRWGGG